MYVGICGHYLKWEENINGIMKFIVLIIWLVLFVAVINFCLDMVSSANTIKNLVGVFGIAAILVLSHKTKCLTTIKIKKHEK